MMQNKSISLKTIMAFIIITLIVIYVAMIIDTIPVMQQAQAVFLGNISNVEEIKNKVIARYNKVDYLRQQGESVANVDVMLIRLFTFHNFVSKGFIQVLYSLEVEGNDGKILYGSWLIPSCWYIEKKSGQWEVTGIKESP
jgi:hypothetical protein